MDLELTQIQEVASTQTRVRENQGVVEEYADVLRDGGELPPAVVFYTGDQYLLADGYHRKRAHRIAGRLTMPVEVRQGTERDAFMYALGANGGHGLRRTREDNRRVVRMALADEVLGELSSRELAKVCNVTHTLVQRIRREDAMGGVEVVAREVQQMAVEERPEVPPPALPIPDDPALPEIPPPPPEVVDSYEAARDEANALLRQIAVEAREAAARVRAAGIRLEKLIAACVEKHDRSPVMPSAWNAVRGKAQDWKYAGGLADAAEGGVYGGTCAVCKGAGCGRCANLGWMTAGQLEKYRK